VFVYREGISTSSPTYLVLEVGLYRMPNLVGSATVITDYSPIVDATYSQTYGPENLINNLDIRSTRWDLPPIITPWSAFSAATTASFNSCFRVDPSTITGPYVLGLDHGYPKI
jgi:hypothetical protein